LRATTTLGGELLEQVHGQIPFGKVPLQAENPLDRLPPKSAEEQFTENWQPELRRVIDNGEQVGRYKVIQVTCWFDWDGYVVPERRWGQLPPSMAASARFLGKLRKERSG